jgi:hypothetical protein
MPTVVPSSSVTCCAFSINKRALITINSYMLSSSKKRKDLAAASSSFMDHPVQVEELMMDHVAADAEVEGEVPKTTSQRAIPCAVRLRR